MASAAVLYVWGIAGNGWANAYYSAAVQAGQYDPVSFFFGSSDWGNSITVDKPPLSLWVMGLSVRLFGLNTWALLLPQAAMTMASTLLIYRLARRHLPTSAALLSAAVFASTPITVLLARYNNPDPLMVLLMLSALYAGIRATESGRTRFLYLAAFILALGFLTKQLQAFLVLPAIGLVFCFYAQKAWRTKVASLFLAGLVLAVGSLAWPLAVDLTPPSSRPYVGGSATNSMFELTVGYNGINRVVQHKDDPSVALIPQELRSIETDAGLFRLFNSNYGQEIGWLLLPALLACIAIVVKVLRGRYSRNKSILAVASVAWMFTTYLMLSFMGNSFHSYYTASIVAPLALCIGLGAELLTSPRQSHLSRIGIAAAVVSSCIFSHAMWQLSDAYPQLLGIGLLLLGLLAGALLSVPAPWKWVPRLAAWLAIGSLLVGPAFCSTIALATPQEGSNPLSGGLSRSPNTLSRFLYGVKQGDPAWASGLAIGVTPSPVLAEYLRNASAECTWAAATYPGQTAARFQLEIGRPVMPLGGFAAIDPSPTLVQFKEWVQAGRLCYLVEQPEQLKVPGNGAELLAIHEWVANTFRAEKIDGVTVYKLTR
ncbi:glycosyltransferase family 39 protein [Arthrobacter sp. Soil736]|uniref:ArnT family glycosyltransferase n=1 Tax=Arthrobacter sp. Soil736 TaxID=1736395 RepID=UPI0019106426|nr:glycosyltransferase family 39 protein [Arthrobacter sp. Soil736]